MCTWIHFSCVCTGWCTGLNVQPGLYILYMQYIHLHSLIQQLCINSTNSHTVIWLCCNIMHTQAISCTKEHVALNSHYASKKAPLSFRASIKQHCMFFKEWHSSGPISYCILMNLYLGESKTTQTAPSVFAAAVASCFQRRFRFS